jgi:hypothetical protein
VTASPLAVLLAATLGVLAAVASAPAFADARVRTTHVPSGGPVWVGPDVFWATAAANGALDVMRSTPGRAPGLFQRFEPEQRREVVWGDLSGTRGRLALELTRFGRGGHTYRPDPTIQAFHGARGEPLRAIGAMCPVDQFRPVRAIDTAGHSVAFRGTTCPLDAFPPAVVRDFPPAPPRERALPPRAFAERVAGRHLAFLEAPVSRAVELAVADAATERELFRLPVPSPVRGFDLNGDGTVALTYEASMGRANVMRLAWASPAEPRLHVVPLPRSGHVAARLAGDRLVVVRARRHSFGPVPGGVLELRELDGRLVRTLARGVDSAYADEGFDVSPDRGRVTFVTRSCAGAAIRSVSFSAAQPTRFGAPARCPLRLRAPLRVAGDREDETLAVRASCRGLVARCVVDRALATVGDRRGRRRIVARIPGHSEPGGRVAIPLTAYGRRVLLRRGRSPRVTVTVWLADIGGESAPLVQRRSGRFRVRGWPFWLRGRP